MEETGFSTLSELVAGKIIGFHIAVMDFDGDSDRKVGYPESVHSFNGVQSCFMDAGDFVDGMLIPCGVAGCGPYGGDSAVRVDSWGRIKASFR